MSIVTFNMTLLGFVLLVGLVLIIIDKRNEHKKKEIYGV